MEEMLLELEEWKSKYQDLEDQHRALQLLLKHYEECFRLSQQKRFGASSERTDCAAQMLLIFDEAENEATPKEPEPTVEEISYTRRKRVGKREDDLSALPVETVEHVIPEEEQICPQCGETMHVMGHETRRELEIIPAQVRVIEHVREVRSCRRCEREATEVPIIKAPIPKPVMKGSVASPSFVAHIMTQKFQNALPLYRQEQGFLLEGFLLSRQTMANWLLRCTKDWLEPLYDLMRERLLTEEVLHADETTVQVLREAGRSSRAESYMWLYRTSGCARHPIVLYEYQPTRSSAHPKRFLAGYRGYLHADGYSGYHNLCDGITICGCWAHARRKFDEAMKSIPQTDRADSAARTGLGFCTKLFLLERDYRNLTPEERYSKRLEQSKPLSDSFFSWAETTAALPKSALGKAIHYALSQRRYLENVYLDGRVEFSNNRAERSIKPFVIGRKNWLFSCSPKGAKASSVIYSIIETAKENHLKPFEYLKHLFETMPNISPERYIHLLPWSDTLPQNCTLYQGKGNKQKKE